MLLFGRGAPSSGQLIFERSTYDPQVFFDTSRNGRIKRFDCGADRSITAVSCSDFHT